MRIEWVATLWLGFVSGCGGGVILTSAGRNVVLYERRTPENCAEIARLGGESGGSVFYGDSAQDDAVRDLRNQAGRTGATHVALTDVDASAHGCRALGVAYRCPPAVVAPPAAPVAPTPAVAPEEHVPPAIPPPTPAPPTP